MLTDVQGEEGLGGGLDVVDLGEDGLFEAGLVGDVAVEGGDPAHRGVEVAEAAVGDSVRETEAADAAARRQDVDGVRNPAGARATACGRDAAAT